MRLLFIAGGFTPPGGIESFINTLSPVLASRNHNVSLLCWGPKNPSLDEIALSGVKVRRQPFRWACRASIPDLLLLARHGASQVLTHDAIIFTKIPPAWLLRSLRRIARAGEHLGSDRSRRPAGSPPVRPFIYVTPYRPTEMWSSSRPGTEVLNCFDSIVVQAPSFATELRAFGYRGQIVTIPLIPPKSVVPLPLPPSDRLRLGFLGRFVTQKNLLYLLDAFSHLAAVGVGSSPQLTRWELHLYGDGPMKREIAEAAATKGLQGQVHFHGAIPHDAVADAIDSCHLFAFSSLSEGQCLAALEILSRGRPIVATLVGAFPEILRTPELGQIAPLDDAALFARTLSAVGADLLEKRLTPHTIQCRFREQFPRDEIVDKYCHLLTATIPHASL